MLVSGLRGRRLRWALALTGALAFVLQGYDQALMNGLLTLPTFEQTFPAINTTENANNSTLQGTVVALYEVGAAFGALACFIIGNHFGRKRTVFGAAVIILVGVTIQASCYSLAQLIVARIITGLGIGGFTATLPTWVGESAEAAERGRLILLQGSGAIFGVMFCSWLELGFYFVGENPVSWRFPIAFQVVFPLIVLVLVPFLPESPRWLIAKERYDQGAEVLSRLEDEEVRSELVTSRVHSIRQSLEADSQGHSGNPFARTSNKHLNRTLLAIAVNVLAQLSGVNIITFYVDSIFEGLLHFTPVTTRIVTSCLQTWQWFFATFAVVLIDRYGRRRLLLVSSALMMIAHAGLAGLQAHDENNTAAECSLIFYFVALGAFPVGLFLVPFMYASEIAPNRIRAKVAAMSTFSNWIFNFLIAEVTPIAFSTISWRYYLVYVCTNALGFTSFYFFAPETKGRTLEDIDMFFIGSKNALQPVKVAKIMPPGNGAYDDKEEGSPEAGKAITP